MADAVEVGSTNVYADLGYPDAEALQRKASLASHIAWTIKARHLTHEAAAQLLGMDQADIMKITRGQSATRVNQRCLNGLQCSATM